jgi:hypothetical protein
MALAAPSVVDAQQRKAPSDKRAAEGRPSAAQRKMEPSHARFRAAAVARDRAINQLSSRLGRMEKTEVKRLGLGAVRNAVIRHRKAYPRGTRGQLSTPTLVTLSNEVNTYLNSDRVKLKGATPVVRTMKRLGSAQSAMVRAKEAASTAAIGAIREAAGIGSEDALVLVPKGVADRERQGRKRPAPKRDAKAEGVPAAQCGDGSAGASPVTYDELRVCIGNDIQSAANAQCTRADFDCDGSIGLLDFQTFLKLQAQLDEPAEADTESVPQDEAEIEVIQEVIQVTQPIEPILPVIEVTVVPLPEEPVVGEEAIVITAGGIEVTKNLREQYFEIKGTETLLDAQGNPVVEPTVVEVDTETLSLIGELPEWKSVTLGSLAGAYCEKDASGIGSLFDGGSTTPCDEVVNSPGCTAKLYQHASYKGRVVTLGRGNTAIYNLKDYGMGDAVSSVKLDTSKCSGAKLKLFTDEGYVGRLMSYRTSSKNVGDRVNDKASSVKFELP